MPEFVIHIGPQKTGTTYLQSAFVASRDQLLENGVCYPDLWHKGPGHALLPKLLEEEAAGLKEQFESWRGSQHKKILLSSEGLSPMGRKEVRRLHSLVGAAPARVVFYIRRWSELVASGWQEMVKRGYTVTLPEYILHNAQRPRRTRAADIEAGLAEWVDTFGAENVRVVSYSKIVDEGGDIFQHFCTSFLGCSVTGVEIGRRNQSLRPIDVEVIRVLNAMKAERGEKFDQPLLKQYTRLTRRDPELLKTVTAVMTAHLVDLVMKDEYPWLSRVQKKAFQKFGNLVVPPAGEGAFYDSKIVKVPYVRPTYFCAEGVVDSLQRIYEYVRDSEPPKPMPNRARREPVQKGERRKVAAAKA